MSTDEQYLLVAGRFMKAPCLIIFSSADFSVDFIGDETGLDSFRSVFLLHGVTLGDIIGSLWGNKVSSGSDEDEADSLRLFVEIIPSISSASGGLVEPEVRFIGKLGITKLLFLEHFAIISLDHEMSDPARKEFHSYCQSGKLSSWQSRQYFQLEHHTVLFQAQHATLRAQTVHNFALLLLICSLVKISLSWYSSISSNI